MLQMQLDRVWHLSTVSVVRHPKCRGIAATDVEEYGFSLGAGKRKVFSRPLLDYRTAVAILFHAGTEILAKGRQSCVHVLRPNSGIDQSRPQLLLRATVRMDG